MAKRRRNIYFGRSSYYSAVPDIGRPGVSSPSEVVDIAAAQLADLGDLHTVSRSGRRVRWSHKLWGARSYIIWRLFSRVDGSKKGAGRLRMILRSGHRIMEIRDRARRVERIKEVLRRAGYPASKIRKLLEKTNR